MKIWGKGWKEKRTGDEESEWKTERKDKGGGEGNEERKGKGMKKGRREKGRKGKHKGRMEKRGNFLDPFFVYFFIIENVAYLCKILHIFSFFVFKTIYSNYLSKFELHHLYMYLYLCVWIHLSNIIILIFGVADL